MKRDPFSPAVVADLGSPSQALTTEIQSSGQIAKADAVVTSPTGSSTNSSGASSIGSGILGGFLSLFPLASVVGKLFGLGGSSSPPPLTPYIQPPSVNFEGAMSGSLSSSTTSSLMGSGSLPELSSSGSSVPGSLSSGSASSSGLAPGVNSLSYGSSGLPRTTQDMPHLAGTTAVSAQDTGIGPASLSRQGASPGSSASAVEQLSSVASSPFVSAPATERSATPAALSQPEGASGTSPDVISQLNNLTSSNFAAEPATNSPISGADLIAPASPLNSAPSASNSSVNGNNMPAAGSSSPVSSSQQGQSILVQVQAMDSQSFMDHSNDIAQAVRQAMLNLHSVNDVIADL